MQDPNHSASFWIGNALLGLALVVLIFLGRLWEMMGSLAMLLWMGMAGAGIYLVTRDKGPSS
ncbi:MAG TPA: hypothetical protein PKH69_00655 [Thiobacillaceae bacterium]|nr:hypothetical protein [Thiobacillaceae bacterium]HNU63376.1 hypothetical protein [Thiobacillaceae bacterium]